MVALNFSPNYEAVKKRIQRLPKLVDDAADTITKKDAVAIIATFQDGIRDGTFNLTPLKPATIDQKRRQGKPQPETPLYGDGDGSDTSYINMFKIRRIKKGYRIYARWARHHDAGIPLRTLFEIHERGALIKKTDGTIIRIPPRPAFQRAFNRHLVSRIAEENVQKVRDAIGRLLREGDEASFKKIIEKSRRDNRYDEA